MEFGNFGRDGCPQPSAFVETTSQSLEAVAKPPLHVDAFVSNASDKDGFLHIDAIETIASTGLQLPRWNVNGGRVGTRVPTNHANDTLTADDTVLP